MRWIQVMGVTAAVAALGCAGATLGSGVGDRFLDRPPYYAGSGSAGGAKVGHLPIAFDASGAVAPEPGSGAQVAGLLRDLDQRLARIGRTIALDGGALPGTPLDVIFGCETDAAGDCHEAGRADKQLRLAVARPGADWVAALDRARAAAGAELVLVVTLEVGQYWVHQRNFAGAKEVRLGRDHAVDVPWLTSLDAPVYVVQLTGALVDSTGRALRIGAEGISVRRTTLLGSGFGLQRLINEEDVARIRTLRREDLPGRPLAWEVALDELVRELTR